jgi:predicted PurR-regulated permease PerM
LTSRQASPNDPLPPANAEPAPPPVAPPPPAPVEPTRKKRLAQYLPRAGLILFVIAILVISRSVLLPFVLAIFFAYLIYPVVVRIERITIARRHPPRWVAVISVYAILFTIGWNAIPPLVGNFVNQVRKLGADAPGLFEQVKNRRKSLDEWIAQRLEVTELNTDARTELFNDVDDLAKGTLEPAAENQLAPPPEPPRAPTAGKGDDGNRTIVIQLFPINLHGADGKAKGEAAGPGGGAPAVPPVGGAEVPAAGEEAAGAPTDGPGDQEKPLRFAKDAAGEFKIELRDAINAELKKPGPAKGVIARIPRELVPELNRRILKLPEDDPQLRIFARNASLIVTNATTQEEFVGRLNGYVGEWVDQARGVVEDQLKELTLLVPALARGIFDFFMVLMLTAFFLVFFPRIRDYFRDLISPQFRDDYGRVLVRIDRRLSGAIRGQVIICLINAALTFPGLWFIGTQTDATNLVSYSVLLSVTAGVLSMIPIFGVILSTVPMVILALAQHSFTGALLVIAWISVIHAIEAYLLNPNILGHSASMNPIIVVFSLLAGKAVGGLVGALLAVPVASVIVSLFGYYRRLVAQNDADVGGGGPSDTWDD